MKAILISIKPKWVAKILNGEKTIEVRKSKPNVDLPIDVYIYCTKQNARYYIENKIYNSMMNGKVVAKFTLNKVEEISYSNGIYMVWNYTTHRACITEKEMVNYLNHKKGYAWHISNLVIFDRPKELGEFEHYNLTEKSYRRFPYCDFNLTKAPQSWQFIEAGE